MKRIEKTILKDIPLRRGAVVTAILLLISSFITIFLPGCTQQEKGTADHPKPNILLLVADDAGWHDVGYHQSEIKTPNIDKLIKTGVELDHFYAYPTCSPTRAALLSGRNPSRYGILGPIAMRSKQILPPETVTLPALLQKKGYITAITGKWHLGLRPENGPRQYGFDHTYGFLHGQIDQYTHKYKNGDRSWHRNDVFIEEEGHATDLITREAVQFIKKMKGKNKPFFLYVSFSVPHYPLQEEEKWVKPYAFIENKSRRLYAASMTHMDAAIGDLIYTLENEQLRDNTIVIFLSDNGAQENWTPDFEYNGKHGPYDRLGNNRPLKDWKGSLYEGGIRVPAVLNWPQKLIPHKVEQVVSVTDIYPTVAHLAGIEVNTNLLLDGQKALPVIANGDSLTKRNLYWRTSGQSAIRRGKWKLVCSSGTSDLTECELYNIDTDPEEKNDIAKQHVKITSKLQSLLKTEIQRDTNEEK
jgi:arylsulfatase A-like enzyme